VRRIKVKRPPRGLPRHLLESKWRLLYRFANGLAGLYGVPIYLCGSALRPDNPDPRDYDIRIMLPDEHFRARYGDVQKWNDEGAIGNWTRVRWRWSADCTKQSRVGFRETGLNVDVQIYPASHARALYGKKRRVRLDTRGR
jgi:hypothetical protein